jgi:hypothetical protein
LYSGAVRWLLLGILAGCSNHTGSSLSVGQHDNDSSAYEECSTICLRPGDCLIAYNDDGICPPGFLCAFHFTCVSDGGTGD